ncbi:response regulator [Sphingomonas sp. SUN019]|uniref:response regulator n=1 Tax=Sphingomonas sp. SUN019 TaxID=2937788 RepID=UPI002164349D|nr:response regulator [Sphingomonas sp. SUN019]UVO49965.1 response regulator [Sphingomonas sp. SUN019]
MNLDLGILWIEDSYSAQEEAELRRRVQEAGFIARIATIPNGADIEAHARENQLFHRYDLILLDYRLKDENGDDLAPKVRSLFPSTTILFYSGSAGDAELRRLIADKNVEGVYCSVRDNFIRRAGELIDQTAQALNRLSGMRGLAMRVVAECDDIMKAAVISMNARHDDCASKIDDLDANVLKDLDETKGKYERAQKVGLPERMATRAVDSAKLFMHFRRLTKIVAGAGAAFGLDDQGVERLRELRKASANYDPKVLGRRNVLGHVMEVKGDTGWVLQGSNEISINDFADIRRDFAAHIDALREMTALVTTLDRQETA